VKPILAIVGRPNVGKSTLFNKIAGKRLAIVENTPGVTRDRLYAEAEWLRYKFTIIDTGGLDPESDDVLIKRVMAQAELAMDVADVVLLVTDGKTGPIEADTDVANMLRKTKKPVLVCANKIDDMISGLPDAYEFYKLGLGEPIPVSAAQGLGIGDLLDEIVKFFPDPKDDESDEDDTIRVAVIGKPNVGKSTLINKILGEERLIVSDVPGTTRDAVDSQFEKDGQRYIFIDTAGLRKKGRVKENVERYSAVRSMSAVARADVCLMLIDANDGISEQDSKIAGMAHEKGRAFVVVVNKWDSIEKDDKTINKYMRDIDNELSFMSYAPKLFISAKTGLRINKLFELIVMAHLNHNTRISTGVLNEVLTEATAVTQPPSDKGRQLKIYYTTQVSVKPPTFVLFVNDSRLMHFSYQRYIENQFREAFGFVGTPIRFVIRNRKKQEGP
jgi:GTP-binding protein